MNCNAPILNQRILRLHAENAAFVAAQRQLGLDGPNFRMVELYDLEDRLAGHLDALGMAGDVAMGLALEALGIAAGFGEVFTVSALALRQRPDIALGALLPPEALIWDRVAALGAAAAWSQPDDIAARMRIWITGVDAMAARVALDVCGLRRIDPRDHLTPLISHRDLRVASRAMQLAGELGRADLAPLLTHRLQTETDPETRFWAAWAAGLLGDRLRAPQALADSIAPGTPAPRARMAAELFPLLMEPDSTKRNIARLLSHPATERWAIVAIAALGAGDTLTWLIRQMEHPTLSRVAGAAFCTITGARIGLQSLELTEFPEEPDDPVVAACPSERFIEAKLYWPDPAKLTAWLHANRSRFAPAARFLLGAAAWTHQPPLDTAAPYQLDHRALSLELATRRPDAPLPNWRGAVILQERGFSRAW